LLEFFDRGIRLRGATIFGALLPVFEVRYEELTDVRLAASRLRDGICFQSSCIPDAVTFKTAEGLQIADSLEERGIIVNRKIGHLE
jgi:hypothetical protein